MELGNRTHLYRCSIASNMLQKKCVFNFQLSIWDPIGIHHENLHPFTTKCSWMSPQRGNQQLGRLGVPSDTLLFVSLTILQTQTITQLIFHRLKLIQMLRVLLRQRIVDVQLLFDVLGSDFSLISLKCCQVLQLCVWVSPHQLPS